jgi:histidine triad (HIT) family protein
MADCLFCRIIAGEIPGKIEYQDEDILILQDINPQAPVHLLVLPKRHIEKVSDLGPADQGLAGRILVAAGQWAQKKGWADYRLVFNNGPEAGQSVFHIHLHLLSGRRMGWPPG